MQLHEYLKSKPKKHIIIDLDETLATLHIDWSDFRNKFFKLVGDFDPDLIANVENVSGAAVHLYNEAIAKHGSAIKETLDDFCHRWELEKYSGLTPNEYLVNFVKKNSDYVYSLWTSNNKVTAHKALEEMGLTKDISTVVSKEDTQLSKPDPEGFRIISKAFEHEINDYLFIGNNQHDEKAAEASGIDFLMVNEY